jgi:RNA polymerase sigma factor (sigma-70 family)
MSDQITESQLTSIYRETLDSLYGYVSRRCEGERQVAEDVTQETWLRAVREWRRAGRPDNPLAWLTTVARNLLSNHYRQHAGVPIDEVTPSEIVDRLTREEDLDSAELVSLVNDALSRLPAGEAGLLEAFHFERQRIAQIAQQHGISERAVEGRLRRARERLRRELEVTLSGN